MSSISAQTVKLGGCNMEDVKVFSYNDNPIHFVTKDAVIMINASQLASASGKVLSNFFELQSTKELMEVIEAKTGNSHTQQITTELDASLPNGDTWVHKNLAIALAQWISPEMHYWCLERLGELLIHGVTASDEMIESMKADPTSAQSALSEIERYRKRAQMLEESNKQLQAKIESDAHKTQFYDNVQDLNEKSAKRKTIVISKIASRLKMKADMLNKHLINEKIIIRIDNGFAVHPQYEDADIAYPRMTSGWQKNEYGEKEYVEHQYLTYTQAGEKLILKSLEKKKKTIKKKKKDE
ncbi:MAG: KilA-N domain-containing protein [Rikenellaceae bacterium]